MDKQFPVCASLGRIHDPLPQLAERVHRVLLFREKTVWTDSNGYVYATPADLLPAISPHTTIGFYAKWTPLPVIEMGLRLALRERASAWIVDWEAAHSLNTRRSNNPLLQPAKPRKRRRKTTDATTQPTASKTAQSNGVQEQS